MIPGQGARIPHASQTKKTNHKNRNNIVTNSISTLKMAHIKKKKIQRSKHEFILKTPKLKYDPLLQSCSVLYPIS